MSTLKHNIHNCPELMDQWVLVVSACHQYTTGITGQNFYAHIDKSGLQFSTKASMVASDLLGMVKMVHLRLS